MIIQKIKARLKAIARIGIQPAQSTYEKGLIQLTNKAAIMVILSVQLIILPAVYFHNLSAPILIINSVFFPLTILFNRYGKYELARHYLILLLYALLLLISLIRGLNSGILFISIPIILLSIIFFYKKKVMYVHSVITILFITFILFYSNTYAPLQPYPARMTLFIFSTHLLISLLLTASFINFFFKLNREYHAELLELNQTKNKLFSILGHDLRSPLNSLRGILSLLKNQHLSQEEFYYLADNLQQNTEQLYVTLENLLQWSLSQMQGFRTEASVQNIHSLVEQQYRLLAETAGNKKISLINELQADCLVYADPNQLELVLRNLLGNALKFTPERGMISISARQENGMLEISVRDSGMGMDEETILDISNTNINKSNKGTHGEKGTGLGLILCRQMIEKNGGRLWVSSKAGEGSTFTFSLPLAENPATRPAA